MMGNRRGLFSGGRYVQVTVIPLSRFDCIYSILRLNYHHTCDLFMTANLSITVTCIKRPLLASPFGGRYRQVALYIYIYIILCSSVLASLQESKDFP